MPATALATRPALPGRVFPADFPPVHVRVLALRPVPQNVRVARSFARDYCAWRGISSAVQDDVSVCLSELATNAVRHAIFPLGRSRFFVQLRLLGPFVSVRVFDPDWQHLPTLGAVSDLGAVSGRGLSLIVRPLSRTLTAGLAAHGLKQIEFTVDCLPSMNS